MANQIRITPGQMRESKSVSCRGRHRKRRYRNYGLSASAAPERMGRCCERILRCTLSGIETWFYEG